MWQPDGRARKLGQDHRNPVRIILPRPGVPENLTLVRILMGIGIGCTLQTTMLAVQADNEKHMIPQATSILTYAQFLGGIFALAIAGYVSR